ncbi:hypothetical protein EEJ34_18770 [Vibrio cholerae]|uniref:hypothetical protein n=1 Tax=Vibrio cholerae TaxID=666 RepID=UPI000F3D7A67|nr:hypothetical protein [Vibrio cholerae]EGQ7944433.1 hypothetical protein [Vibrio cholerae]EGQ8412162.1 hypothetical protein [Vibrio cholerae]EGS7961897.1 hypothetical protein [Vibrio cholerae]EII3003696.1 hypothetical protein [Vibrio cholerae]EKF9835923.1 hypothetical protein [Vibrio cholerae]
MKNKEISDYVDSFSMFLIEYDKNLNIQGIWLFLATLGCWSVPEGGLRITAFLITLLIFFNNLFLVWETEKKHVTFKAGFSNVERKISELENSTDRESWTEVLNHKKVQHLRFIGRLKRSPIYIVSFVFHVVCLSEVLI